MAMKGRPYCTQAGLASYRTVSLKRRKGGAREHGQGTQKLQFQWFLFLLQLVSKEDPKALAVALNWDIKKAETVQQACNTELTLRLQQMQSLRSLRNFSARKNPLPGEQQSPKRAKQDPE
ncbi:DNA fragmentation factor subunit alpha [Cricetulus griseus]|uniref:DNAation factor subunit alpha n=1 Tax=Cricetulus griseus TaxID=10029 RepID=G3IQ86_CRIGR|nr:DNA fragmentation factor subunit alpha [Cricetulus griseus]